MDARSDLHQNPRPGPEPAEAKKAEQVRRMFSAIHNRYDRINRLMTLGRDQAWRRAALREVALPAQGLLLDVATGSGDVLLQAARLHLQARGVGLDFTPEMLRRARARLRRKNLIERFPLIQADALALPFRDGAFDAVISAFMMRNVANVLRALEEQRRVVRPGGRVVCLELTWPRNSVFRRLFALYFYCFVPWFGGLLSGYPQAYHYLPASVEGFFTPEQVRALMERAGLTEVHYRHLMWGTVTIHVGARPALYSEAT